MKFSTEIEKSKLGSVKGKINLQALVAQEWDQVILSLPEDLNLEESARSTKALLRRREVKNAIDLLRLVLAYSASDWSLRMVGMWGTVIGLGNLSDVAVLKRLRNCELWLGKIIGAILRKRRVQLTQQAGIRLRIIDGTTASKPGSQGTDWRLQLSMDLENLCLDSVEVTDAHGGETMARFETRPGDILLGDRGYAFANSMAPVLEAGSRLVVRINWQNLPLEEENGERIDLIEWLREINSNQPAERNVRMNTPQGQYQLRLIAGPLPQEAAEAARRRVRKAAREKGRTPDQRTLFAAGFTISVTNLLASWSAQDVLALYRIRWQVELVVKRLKRLLHLDGLRTQDAKLGQVYLLGKLLAALLLDELTHKVNVCYPQWFRSTERPISLWRLQTLLWDQLCQIIRGVITLTQILASLSHLERYLCDPPRKRIQQLAYARSFLQTFSSC